MVLPENKVSVQDEIAGVRLSPEQRHDLREGKAVQLAQMSRPDGGKPFDGTAQINAATAGVEVRPAAHELAQKQAPAARQTREPDPVKQPAPTVAATATEALTPQVRGPRV